MVMVSIVGIEDLVKQATEPEETEEEGEGDV
jgi:hypothetical protein